MRSFLTAAALLVCLAWVAAHAHRSRPDFPRFHWSHSQHRDEWRSRAAARFDRAQQRLDRMGERLHRAGERIGQRFEYAGVRLDDAGERASDRLDAAGDRLDEAGDSLGDQADRLDELADRLGERADRAGERIGTAAERFGEHVGVAAGRFGEHVGEAAGRFGEHVGETAGRFGERVGETAGRLGERVGETAGHLGERVGVTAGHFGERVGETAERASERFGERLERAGERFEQLGRTVNQRGVRFRVATDYYLPAGATLTQPLVVIGGDATIDGHAESDVVVVGGRLRAGPRAAIGGDVLTFAGNALIDPKAQFKGRIHDAALLLPDFSLDEDGHLPRDLSEAIMGFTIIRLGLVLTMSTLLTLVARRWVTSISTRMSSSPIGSAFTGVAGQVLALPALVALTTFLAVSVIGIPLLGAIPFLMGAFGIVWTAGFAAAAARLGSRLRGKAPGSEAGVFDVVLGFSLLTAMTVAGNVGSALAPGAFGELAPTLIPAGLVVEYLAWTVGLGAALRSIVCRRRVVPPPLPAAATATA